MRSNEDFGWSTSDATLHPPGELIGFRYWRMHSDGSSIESVTRPNHTWSIEGNVADCDTDISHVLARPADRDAELIPHGESPAQWCKCGFYAWYKASEAVRNHGRGDFGLWNASLLSPTSVLIFGAIAASGRIIPGTTGFRAEKARLLGLMVPEGISWLPTGLGFHVNHFHVNHNRLGFDHTGSKSLREHLNRRYPELPLYRNTSEFRAAFPDTVPPQACRKPVARSKVLLRVPGDRANFDHLANQWVTVAYHANSLDDDVEWVMSPHHFFAVMNDITDAAYDIAFDDEKVRTGVTLFGRPVSFDKKATDITLEVVG